MFFQKIKTPGIAHISYVIGDEGVAAVVDPRRDIDEYLDICEQNGLSIRYILETHRQEDFVMGAAALRKETDAPIVSGDHPIFAHSDIRLKDGETLELGKLVFKALLTPGHTQESTCYAVFTSYVADKAWCVFTGDTLLPGETGRSDLPGFVNAAQNAALLYDSIHQKLLPLGDHVLVLAAHGTGAVCGVRIADLESSSIGFEKFYNPAFTKTRSVFIEHKLHERLSQPRYFIHMEEVNLRGGIPPFVAMEDIPVLQPKDFQAETQGGSIIDTRLPEAYAGGHIPGSYSIWLEGLPIYAGEVVSGDSPVFLVLERAEDLRTAVLQLSRVGIDQVRGVLAGGFEEWRDQGLPVALSGTITPDELRRNRDRYVVLDVRERDEFEDGHIRGALSVPVGELEGVLSAGLMVKEGPGPVWASGLSTDSNVVVTCSAGYRGSLGVSILKRHGFLNVSNLLGGMTAWTRQGLPEATAA